MSVKAVGITCIAAAISYGLGMIGGAVAALLISLYSKKIFNQLEGRR